MATASKGFLGWVERTGNRLPDPVFLFLYLMAGLVALSVVAALAGLSVLHPTQKLPDGSAAVVAAESLLSAKNVARLWVDMPKTFMHFHPLGYVLIVMLGAGVAERSGLFSSAMTLAVRRAPTKLLTPMVALVAMIANHAADAAYVVLIPLAGVLYSAAGRHPLAGIAASFAGVSGGFSANIVPGQLDALLFGITEQSAESLVPTYDANIAGNWYFIVGMTISFLPVIWWVTDRVVEPRLGAYRPESASEATEASKASEDAAEPERAVSDADVRRGLRHAALAALAVVLAWGFMVFGPGTPLIDEAACPNDKLALGKCSAQVRLTPLYQSLVAAFFLMFLVAGWAYGAAVGAVKGHRDIVKMMTAAMKDLGYYLVLAFAAAHFVALFNWSNLGLIFAVQGAFVIEKSGLPLPLLLGLIVAFSAFVNLFIGSASAKWALLAPVMVPMLMLSGVSPEGTTAAYRVGDSVTNIITPLMVYFPLILIFCRRWQREYGLGSLTAMMLPYSMWLLAAGLVLTIGWVGLDFDLGPGAPVRYLLPAAKP